MERKHLNIFLASLIFMGLLTLASILYYRADAVKRASELTYQRLSDSAKEQLLGSGYGGTKIQLSLEDIKELVIAVPPKEEQILIANYIDEKLNQFEHLIKQANKLVMTLQERRTALISSAVTGKIDVRNWQSPKEATTELSQ